MSGQSKVVVDILELLFEMLHQNPKSRPRISVVEQRLSKILQHQVPLCVIRPEKLGAPEGTDEHESDTYDDGVEVLAKVTPRTSKDRYSILSRLSIPFTYTSLMPWNWIYPTKTEPPIPKVGRTQSQPFKAMTSRKQLRAPSLTSQELRDSMAPRAPLKDHLEGPLQALQGYDTVFLVDDSKIDEQHWLQMGQVLINVASVAMQLDPDGIDIRFVASDHCEVEEVKAWKDVADAFSSVQPCERRLVLGHRVNSILEPYIQAQADKEKGYRHSGPSKSKTHLNLIVLTDGQLDDDDDLDKVIINCVKRLDELRAPSGSIGVQFVLFGRRDSRLSRLFEYLDDEVAVEIGSLRDIVDTTEFSREMLEDRNAFKKILCGSINKTLDGPGRLAPGNSSSTDPGNSSTRRRAT
ncbi:hypothetical protein K440DRAFT_615854 [Wilcoxina mikolae CBS 423.85]|nr:hypothetical protein K440DRAFT_615854 [Wilcoxina mikolae CBS 423.85]